MAGARWGGGSGAGGAGRPGQGRRGGHGHGHGHGQGHRHGQGGGTGGMAGGPWGRGRGGAARGPWPAPPPPAMPPVAPPSRRFPSHFSWPSPPWLHACMVLHATPSASRVCQGMSWLHLHLPSGCGWARCHTLSLSAIFIAIFNGRVIWLQLVRFVIYTRTPLHLPE